MKFKTLLITVAVAAMMGVSAFAQDISVTLNGELINFPNQAPISYEGRTLIPLRGLFDNMGYTINWDSESKTAYLSKGDDTISITIGEAAYRLNGEEYSIDVPAQIINGSTMIPMRAVAEATGLTVLWDDETKIATLIDPSLTDSTPQTGTVYVDSLSEKDYIQSYTQAITVYNSTAKEFYDCVNANVSANFENEDLLMNLFDVAKRMQEVSLETKENISALNCPSKFNELHKVSIEYMDAIYDASGLYVKLFNGDMTLDEFNEELNTVGTSAMLKEAEYKKIAEAVING